MRPKLQVSQSVISRLGDARHHGGGAVFGTMYNNTLLVLGLSVDTAEGKSAEPYTQLQYHFPTEIDFCGVVIFTDDTDDCEIPPDILDILKEVLVTDNPLILKRAVNSSALRAYFYCNEKLVEAEYEVLSEAEICQRFVHVRLRTLLPFKCEPEPNSIHTAVNNLQKQVSSGSVGFHLAKTEIFLFGTEGEGKITVGEVFEAIRSSDAKKKTINTLLDTEVVTVSLLDKATRDGLNEDSRGPAPFVQHIKCKSVEKRSVQVDLAMDHLALVYRERPIADLYNVLVDTMCRSLRLFEHCLSQGHKQLSPPRVYHFLPVATGHFLTVAYLSNQTDSELVNKRDSLHRQLNLPKERPLFRRGNAHVFSNNVTSNSPLVNPHEGLQQQVKGGEMSLVYGRYSYHHYLQGGMQDDGWGCAYRSLQTIVSWFRYQGYTDRPIPTHQEIQQCLVDIGDKSASFVGSRQWIGSMEVSFCLDTMLGVTCRILNFSSGAELADIGSDLARHFSAQGTPIMIGGGVLAHTILGVDVCAESGELRFLVLDPHYTGADDLRTVQQKGWVSWKKPDFWNKTAHYNLCLPLRPICF